MAPPNDDVTPEPDPMDDLTDTVDTTRDANAAADGTDGGVVRTLSFGGGGQNDPYHYG